MLLVFILLFLIVLIITTELRLFIDAKNKNFEVFLKIYIFGFICVGKVNLKKFKTKYGSTINLKMKNKINKAESTKLFIKTIKKFPGRVKKFQSEINICTTDAVLTACSVALVSSTISFLLGIFRKKIKSDGVFYKVNPIYSGDIMINIKLQCIITVNLVHIITTIYKSIKEWRREGNGRKSSNRKPYGNCYE